MRKLSLLLFLISFIIFGLFGFTSLTNAQDDQHLYFAVTTYNTREDIDFLINHSIHPVDYLEGGDIKVPVFLSIITPQQKSEYITAGYKPVIIDNNAGSINQYYMVTADDPNTRNLLKVFDVVYPISDTNILIKLPKGKNIFDYRKGDLLTIEAKMYYHDLVPPQNRTKYTYAPSPTVTIALSLPPIKVSENNRENSPFILVILFLVLINSGVIAGYFYLRRRNRMKLQPKNL